MVRLQIKLRFYHLNVQRSFNSIIYVRINQISINVMSLQLIISDDQKKKKKIKYQIITDDLSLSKIFGNIQI